MGDGLLLRGVRWRLGLSLLTVLTAAIAVATAVLGPMYLHTAGDSVLRRAVDSAALQTRGVTVTPYYTPTRPLALARQAERIVEREPVAAHLFGAPITTAITGVTIPTTIATFGSNLFFRTGICGKLHILRGSCRLGRDDVVMTARSARQVHTGLGDALTVSLGPHAELTVRVIGIAATPDLAAAYWWGQGVAEFPFGTLPGPHSPTPTDSLITSQATALSASARSAPSVTVQLPVRPGSVDLADQATVTRDLDRAAAALQPHRLHLSTGLGGLLSGADHQRRVMATIVAIAATQLVVLAVWVLGSLLVRSGDARRRRLASRGCAGSRAPRCCG